MSDSTPDFNKVEDESQAPGNVDSLVRISYSGATNFGFVTVQANERGEALTLARQALSQRFQDDEKVCRHYLEETPKSARLNEFEFLFCVFR